MTFQKTIYLPLILFILAMYTPAESKREYRKVVLPNQLKVILVSDPEVNISSASMDVGIGAIADPEDRKGMAHFLEHMLFLGTKKYPKLNEYGEYLKSRGGYSNAFTAQDHTNYHFQVSHDGLPEALDRFAQFFIDPLLDHRFAQREVHAVNAEHLKNIYSDSWRLMQLRRSNLHPDHPENTFSTGNMETLGGTTAEELRKFYEDYYGPERMALCVLSKLSLDRLENMVKEKFSAIPARKVKEFSVDKPLLEKKDFIRFFQVVPVQEIQQLKLFFPIPSQHKNERGKVYRLLGMTMGDEGQGSLLSLLKEEGLASSLSAGIGNDTKFYSSCHITVGLTEKGLKEYRHVLELCFSYIKLLKTEAFPAYLWEEMKTMSQLQEKYSPKGEGTDIVIGLAQAANEYGVDEAETIAYTYENPSEKTYQEILASLTPSNMLVFLVAKNLKTDKKEKWYQIDYSYEEVAGKFYESLQSVPRHPKLHLPKPNPFVPKSTQVLSMRPIQIRQDSKATLWYLKDDEFKRPKVAMYFHILTPEAYRDERSVLLTELYTYLIQEQLNEFSYPALLAGLKYSLSATKEGILFQVSGYSDSALPLMQTVASKLKNLEVSNDTFLTVKDQKLRAMQSFPYARATTIVREVSRKINLKKYYTLEDLLPLLDKIELEDVKQFVGTLYHQSHIQGLCHGNLTQADAERALEILEAELDSRPFSPEDSYQDEVLWLQSGDDLVYQQVLPTNNSCLRIEYQVGVADLKTRVTSAILDRAIRNGFYTEMRTKQMLGYIVFSGSYLRENVQNMVFIIQSGTHPAHDLSNRADTFIAGVPEMIQQLAPENFEAIRDSLIKDREKKAKSIVERASALYNLAYTHDGNFTLNQEEIAALKDVTLEDVQNLAKSVFSEETRRRLTILLYAKEHQVSEKKPSITDISQFHQGRVFDRK